VDEHTNFGGVSQAEHMEFVQREISQSSELRRKYEPTAGVETKISQSDYKDQNIDINVKRSHGNEQS